MFTLQSFSIFFWSLATVILLMIIFEDKLIAIEKEYDKKKEMKKQAKISAQKKANISIAKTHPQHNKKNSI